MTNLTVDEVIENWRQARRERNGRPRLTEEELREARRKRVHRALQEARKAGYP